MDHLKRPLADKWVFRPGRRYDFYAFLAAGAVLGARSAMELREMVADQFNEEQLVIAHSIGRLVERELDKNKKGTVVAGPGPVEPGLGSGQSGRKVIHDSLVRVRESGVCQVEIVNGDTKKSTIFTPYNSRPEIVGAARHPDPARAEVGPGRGMGVQNRNQSFPNLSVPGHGRG